MTVKELIEELQKVENKEIEVFIFSDYWEEYEEVSLSNLNISKNDHGEEYFAIF